MLLSLTGNHVFIYPASGLVSEAAATFRLFVASSPAGALRSVLQRRHVDESVVRRRHRVLARHVQVRLGDLLQVPQRLCVVGRGDALAVVRVLRLCKESIFPIQMQKGRIFIDLRIFLLARIHCSIDDESVNCFFDQNSFAGIMTFRFSRQLATESLKEGRQSGLVGRKTMKAADNQSD